MAASLQSPWWRTLYVCWHRPWQPAPQSNQQLLWLRWPVAAATTDPLQRDTAAFLPWAAAGAPATLGPWLSAPTPTPCLWPQSPQLLHAHPCFSPQLCGHTVDTCAPAPGSAAPQHGPPSQALEPPLLGAIHCPRPQRHCSLQIHGLQSPIPWLFHVPNVVRHRTTITTGKSVPWLLELLLLHGTPTFQISGLSLLHGHTFMHKTAGPQPLHGHLWVKASTTVSRESPHRRGLSRRKGDQVVPEAFTSEDPKDPVAPVTLAFEDTHSLHLWWQSCTETMLPGLPCSWNCGSSPSQCPCSHP